MATAIGESNLDGNFDGAAALNDGEVDGGTEDGRLAGEGGCSAGKLNRERRREALQIEDADLRVSRCPGCNVAGQKEFELQSQEDQATEETRNQHQRQHRGKHQEEQVVAGEKRSAAGDDEGEQEEQTSGCDAVTDAPPQEAANTDQRSPNLLPPLAIHDPLSCGRDASFRREITLKGGDTIVRLNGEVVNSFHEGQEVPERKVWFEPERGPRPDSGYIGLQNHDGKSAVVYREISVSK